MSLRYAIMSTLAVPVNVIVGRVSSEIEPVAILQPVWRKPNTDKTLEDLFHNPLQVLKKYISSVYLKRLEQKLSKEFKTILKPHLPAVIPFSPIKIPWEEINSEKTKEKLKELDLDLLILCGAPILKPDIFNIPRLGTLNVHFGIIPNYRGEHTIAWPIIKNDYNNVGASIHKVEKQVDKGEVFIECLPELVPCTTEAEIYSELSLMLADELTYLLKVCNENNKLPKGTKDQSLGEGILIKFKDRFWHHDYQLRKGSCEMPERKQEVKRYF